MCTCVLGAGEQKDTSPAVKGLYFMEETGIPQFNTQIDHNSCEVPSAALRSPASSLFLPSSSCSCHEAAGASQSWEGIKLSCSSCLIPRTI